MQRYFYAILDDTSICIGLIDTPSEIDLGNYIPLGSYDESVVGKMWTGEGWIENPNPPEPVEE